MLRLNVGSLHIHLHEMIYKVTYYNNDTINEAGYKNYYTFF